MIQKLKKAWNDPVWSTIISAGIIMSLSIIYSNIKSMFGDKSFLDELKSLLNTNITLIGILIWGLTFIVFVQLFKWLINNYQFFYSDSHKAVDRELFEKIQTEILPSNDGITFIRSHDFGGAFLNNNLFDFRYYLTYLDKPEFEFINLKLNRDLNELSNSIANFISIVSLKTEVDPKNWTGA